MEGGKEGRYEGKSIDRTEEEEGGDMSWWIQLKYMWIWKEGKEQRR